MLLPVLAVLCGLTLLAFGSDRLITGAAAIARRTGIQPLLIGIVLIGFGTSVPELIVSTIAALQGNPALAVGNAFGSNIVNIALILGLIAVVSPIRFQSGILRKELPLLTLVTLTALFFLWNLHISRSEGLLLLLLFAAAMTYTLRTTLQHPQDPIAQDLQAELPHKALPLPRALLNLIGGLLLLILSSRALVWGAVVLATALGVSDLIIGLSVLALGTSLPELAAGFASIRKGEHELVVGNVVGSNLFNTLAVTGIAGTLAPHPVEPGVLQRDLPAVLLLTLSLFAIGYGHKRPGRINRIEGLLLLTAYAAYLTALLQTLR